MGARRSQSVNEWLQSFSLSFVCHAVGNLHFQICDVLRATPSAEAVLCILQGVPRRPSWRWIYRGLDVPPPAQGRKAVNDRAFVAHVQLEANTHRVPNRFPHRPQRARTSRARCAKWGICSECHQRRVQVQGSPYRGDHRRRVKGARQLDAHLGASRKYPHDLA